MARSKRSAAPEGGGTSEALRTLLPILTDLIPLFFEKWAEIYERPGLKEVQQDQAKTERRLTKLVNQIRWHYPLFFLLAVWNVILTVFLFLQ